jgi:hypothetical protein
VAAIKVFQIEIQVVPSKEQVYRRLRGFPVSSDWAQKQNHLLEGTGVKLSLFQI